MWNKFMHSGQGNVVKAMKVDFWNAGYARLENELNQIKNIIQVRKCHILFIGEANLWEGVDEEKVKIKGYKLQTCCMIKNVERKCSRIVAYVKEFIKFKVIQELEDRNFSSIWMEVGLPTAASSYWVVYIESISILR